MDGQMNARARSEREIPADTTLNTAIESLQQDLVDTSRRTKLTNTSLQKGQSKQLVFREIKIDAVFTRLVNPNGKLNFRAAADEDQDGGIVTQDFSAESRAAEQLPDTASGRPETVTAAPQESALAQTRQGTFFLQSLLTQEILDARLLQVYRQARSFEDEQGVSVLFLALGFLHYYEAQSSDQDRYAPLILMPVDLVRNEKGSKFRLSRRDQDIENNLSLAEMLKAEFGLELPAFPQGEDWSPSGYFAQVEEVIRSKPRWGIVPNAVLSFYSFAKFLMHKDLEELKASITDDSLFSKIVKGGGFERSGSIIEADVNLDRKFPEPRELVQILDADSSQTQVIAAARAGRNLVVQGPPGTGKSQTIGNLIAAAVSDGKSVLFVAEKKAALDVVHDRLDRVGLGPMCLELHAHKANRKAFYEGLRETLELAPPTEVLAAEFEKVKEVRDELNRLSDLMHTVDATTGRTPFGVIAKLAEFVETDCPVPGPALAVRGVENWSRDAYQKGHEAMKSLADLTVRFGAEMAHPWRGAQKRLVEAERMVLKEKLHKLSIRTASLRECMERARSVLQPEEMPDHAGLRSWIERLEHVAVMPALVKEWASSELIWVHFGQARELCRDIGKLQQIRAESDQEYIDSAWEMRWEETRLILAAHGKSWFRSLRSAYRNHLGKLKAVIKNPLPKDLDGQLALVDRLLEAAKLERAISEQTPFGQQLFDLQWRGAQTDLSRVEPSLQWLAHHKQWIPDVKDLCAWVEHLPGHGEYAAQAAELQEAYAAWSEPYREITEHIDLDAGKAFQVSVAEQVRLDVIFERLDSWTCQTEKIGNWHMLWTMAEQVSELGIEPFRQALASQSLEAQHAENSFLYVYFKAVWDRLCSECPELESISGEDRSRKIEEFCQMDVRLQELAAQEIALKHYSAIPQGAAGDMGLIRSEVNKKARHLPIRQLLDKVGTIVQTIKPVFLMSPLSVSKFLRPGGLKFDMLLIDEASQIRPADGVGAILRADQIVVVGDQKQLPPTSFFHRQTDSEDDMATEEIEEIQAKAAADMESILSLCEARGMENGMLRWHYRSEHPSLIRVSNHEFYDEKLICPPTPDRAGKYVGLTFTHVDGMYRRGRKRDNPLEAEAIAEAVLAHARELPDKSLGVVALSVSQRDTIQEAVDRLSRDHAELRHFCGEGRNEAFFVKNLENVQGDERDVIFISIGYGKDEDGYMTQSFGPVSNEGGERRLNVLFTRSKRQCRVFSSIRHSDIRVDTKHVGPQVLRRFLRYAETGEFDIPKITGREMDSPFEVAVAKALQKEGYKIEAQVGSAGFLIDLAVYDPDDEGRFLLAIECDGARYHSSAWARERDRLRQSVLESKGWKFHRIWSTDWFYNKSDEMRKLLNALDHARAENLPVGQPSSDAEVARKQSREISRRAEVSVLESAAPRPYRYASLERPATTLELNEMHQAEVADLVRKVIEIEGPIHRGEIARRISVAWGTRLGSRQRRAIEDGIGHAWTRKWIQPAEGDDKDFFLSRAEPPDIGVRDRSGVDKQLRDGNMIAGSEIQVAIRQVIQECGRIEREDCPVEVRKLFGLKSTTQAFRNRIDSNIDSMIRSDKICIEDDKLALAPASTNLLEK